MKWTLRLLPALLLLAGLALWAGCKKDVDGCTDPEATNYSAKATKDDGTCKYPPACEANETGEVYFVNHSNTNSTYDVIWNGAKIATVAPGQSSQVFTYPANVQHSLVFRLTNSSTNACTPSTPYLTQCQRLWFDCTK